MKEDFFYGPEEEFDEYDSLSDIDFLHNLGPLDFLIPLELAEDIAEDYEENLEEPNQLVEDATNITGKLWDDYPDFKA